MQSNEMERRPGAAAKWVRRLLSTGLVLGARVLQTTVLQATVLQTTVVHAAAPADTAVVRLPVAGTGSPGVVEQFNSPEFPAGVHVAWDRLLKTYVTPDGVRYDAWAAKKSDRLAVTEYVYGLERFDTSTWTVNDQKAYWINLYNAATIRLVLKNYPLKSIKALKAPWDTKVVTVAGADYTLNGIENKILRPKFKDPRIHFALNCAAAGCPPLRIGAFTADSLDRQLNNNCRRALNDPKHLAIAGYSIQAPRIFDWYSGDFGADPMNIREFMARYVPDNVARRLTDPAYKLGWLDYDWQLNRAAE